MTVVCSRPLLWASLAALPLGSFLVFCCDYLSSHSSRGGVWEWSGMRGVVCWIQRRMNTQVLCSFSCALLVQTLVVPRLNFCLRLQCLGTFSVFAQPPTH